MSKKTTTTSNQQTHNVSTPTNPEWVTSGVQGVAGKISDLGNLDPYSLIAGADPLQTQAANSAANLSGSPWNFGAASDVTRGVIGASAPQVQSASLLDGLQNYMNPYTNDVVNTTLNDFDVNAGRTRAQQSLNLAGQGAFGGSGAALTQSQTEGELARARATADATLRDSAFNTGAGLSGQDAQRRQDASSANAQLAQQQQQQQLQAAQQLANLSTQSDATQRANIAMQGDLGQQLRAIQQAQLGAPISLAGTQAGLLGSLPLGLFQGQTSDGTSSGTQTQKVSDPMGTIGSLAMMAAAPFTGGASLAGLGGLGAAFGGAGAAAGLTGTLAAGGAGALSSSAGVLGNYLKSSLGGA